MENLRPKDDPELPSRPKGGCTQNTIECRGLGCPDTCYCEDHCSWEKCFLESPPHDCLLDTNGVWSWNARNKYWNAKSMGNMQCYSRKYIKCCRCYYSMPYQRWLLLFYHLGNETTVPNSTSTKPLPNLRIEPLKSEKNAIKKIEGIYIYIHQK